MVEDATIIKSNSLPRDNKKKRRRRKLKDSNSTITNERKDSEKVVSGANLIEKQADSEVGSVTLRVGKDGLSSTSGVLTSDLTTRENLEITNSSTEGRRKRRKITKKKQLNETEEVSQPYNKLEIAEEAVTAESVNANNEGVIETVMIDEKNLHESLTVTPNSNENNLNKRDTSTSTKSKKTSQSRSGSKFLRWLKRSALNRLMLGSLIIFLFFIAVHDKMIAHIVTWYLHRKLSYGKDPNSFNLQFGYISVRLGFDRNELYFGDFLWQNPPEFKQTPHFVKIGQVMLLHYVGL